MNYTSIEQSKKLLELGLKAETSDISSQHIVSPEYEEWRDIKGFEGKYKISSLGRVMSLNYQRKGVAIIMKVWIDKRGYCSVNLRRDGKPHSYAIHRLVAEAFLDNPNNLPVVNHLDENPTNNFVFNLEWSSSFDNFHYGTADNRKHKSMLKAIYQCDKDGNIIKQFDSVYKAGEELNIKPQNITANLTGRQLTCGGFKFFYVTKYNLPNHGFIKKF